MRTTILFLAVALAACSSAEPGAPGVRLTARVDRSLVQSTDSVRISLTLTNVSAQPMQVMPAEAYGFCMHAFEVFDVRNRPVSVAQGLCALVSIWVPAPVTLRSMESIEINDWWKPAESSIDGAPLVPGAYVLRGRVFAGDQLARSAGRTVVVQ